MIRRVLVSLAAAFFVFSAAVAVAEEKPGGEASQLVVVTATVEKIDLSTREVTLKGIDGSLETVKVGPEARNLDQVKVGDKVTMKYYRALAIAVTSAANEPSIAEATDVQRAPLGEKPRGRVTKVVEATTTVEAVDLAKRTVTVKGPKGNVRTFNVGDQVKLDQVKVGDHVVTRFTEAVAISVEKP